MGGLDARLAIQKYKLGDRCVSLTTLATPHRGSAVADYVMNHLGETVAMGILQKLFAGDVRAVEQLTSTYITKVFNYEVKNTQKIKYFSMQFYIPRPVQAYSLIAWLWIAHAIQVKAGNWESDGMVSVESARWGETLGTFPGDHITETSPVPLGGRMMYQDVFARVIDNLEAQF